MPRPDLVTLLVIGGVLIVVLFFNANIGMAAFTGAVVLASLRVADHDQSIRRMPWTPILMVSGVSVLVALLEKTRSLDLFTELLAKIATPGTLTGVIANDRSDLGLQQRVRRRVTGVRPPCRSDHGSAATRMASPRR